jgi:hypothetical protein
MASFSGFGENLTKCSRINAAADYLQLDSRHKHGAQPGWPLPTA